MEFRLQETVNAPREKVFELSNDLERAGEWMPNLVRIEPLPGSPRGRGARWRETRRMFGRESTEEFEVTTFEPPSRAEMHVDGAKGTTGRGEFRFRYDYEAAGPGATLVTLSGSVTGMGCLGAVLGVFFSGMLRKAIAKDLAAMKRWIESQSGAPPAA